MQHSRYLSQKYLPQLDGIRAISCLAVISAHMHTEQWKWLSGGRGLIWFYIVSGYLITRLALREEEIAGKVSLAAFYVRRSFRIFPLYFAVLAIYCVLIIGLGVSPEKFNELVAALPYYLTYFQEIPVMLQAGEENLPFGHSWSLGIEEKFYIVWPLIAFMLMRGASKGRRSVALWLTLLLMGVSLLPIGRASMIVYSYGSIMAGCLLALLLQSGKTYPYLRRLAQPGWAFAALSVFAVLHFGVPEQSEIESLALRTSLVRVAYTMATAVLMTSVLLGEGLLQGVLQLEPLLFLGKVSYGIYLVHRLCLNVVEGVVGASFGRMEAFVELVVAGALSAVVAYVLHITIEKPCIAFGRDRAKRFMPLLRIDVQPESKLPVSKPKDRQEVGAA